MREIEWPPEPRLFESMRAVGYTMATALADLIDNSISAQARSVDVLFSADPEPYVAVVDDGTGMDLQTARSAMQLAGTGAGTDRAGDDLGRFGLGLKTASLSQCRELTIVTRAAGGSLIGLRWDLDRIAQTGKWTLQELDPAECDALPRMTEFLKHSHGTLVLWRQLDLFQATHGKGSAAMNRALAEAGDHLRLVFHRFMSDTGPREVKISINHKPLKPADPFLSKHRLTSRSPVEVVPVGGEEIYVTAYTLPHLAELSTEDRELAKIAGPLRDNQGFYVYRGKRLVIWGTWFRTTPKVETQKLSRVRVDIPNSLDHLWALDIKKSRATPPQDVLARLRDLSQRFTDGSRRVTEYKGRKAISAQVPLWHGVEEREGFRYEINRDHPAVALAKTDAAASQVEFLLRQVEWMVPFEDAHIRMSGDAPLASGFSDKDLRGQARTYWSALRSTMSQQEFIQTYRSIDPFAQHVDPTTILKEASDD